ncbi:hypothetical protein LCGC14_0355390 [marine sediment metagenome]|uniref:Uncharacterized protein n=1 Tax=marine sediment metagenome TaxID=412755 RepID=A0A0F9TFC7_9ZZZZ
MATVGSLGVAFAARIQALLDSVIVTTSEGDAHREVIVKGSPNTAAALQEVDATPAAARVVVYDAAGVIISDSTANAAKGLLVDAAGVPITNTTANALKGLLVDAAGVALTDSTANAAKVKIVTPDGGEVTNDTVNAIRTILADPTTPGNEATVVAGQDLFSLHVTDLPPTANVFFGFGEHSFSGAVNNNDVWGGPTPQQPEPVVAGYALFVESDSVEDDTDKGGAVPGTGAHTVAVHYLDTAGAEQEVEISMNGTAPVDTGVTDCMFVQQHHVTGFGAGGGIVSDGNIDCTNTSGGTVVSRITAAGNQSMSTMKQVPAGKTLIVKSFHCCSTATTTKIVNLRIRSSAHNGVLNAGVYQFHDAVRLKDFCSGPIPLQFICPSLATIKVSGWTTGTIDVTARWQGWLQNN